MGVSGNIYYFGYVTVRSEQLERCWQLDVYTITRGGIRIDKVSFSFTVVIVISSMNGSGE